jgi:hypothetical protein
MILPYELPAGLRERAAQPWEARIFVPNKYQHTKARSILRTEKLGGHKKTNTTTDGDDE